MPQKERFEVLDGWRGISILAVLGCHLLPLGPKHWGLNDAAGLFGMAIFFTLSGFLITTFLLKHGDVRAFLIRRVFRILPLAWLVLPVGLLMARAEADRWLPNFLFYANIPPFWLTNVTAHFWSLCVEMQFYGAVALVFCVSGRRGLMIALPAGALIITAIRIHSGAESSVVTYQRADEILAGGILALVYASNWRAALRWLNPWVLLPLFCASTLPGPQDFARPYLAALLVGSTLLRSPQVLQGRTLAYIAEISYALYVLHPLVADTWLGTGSKLVKYLKRPLLFAGIWALAHVSTFYYEKRWIAFGKHLSRNASLKAATA